MRIRKMKNTPLRLEKCASIIMSNPSKHYGEWEKVFGNSNPIHIEIGCGRGRFILETAQSNPQINFIAIEKSKECLLSASEKIISSDLKNVRILLSDASVLGEIFQQGECGRIYLNFSDPWAKHRHAKRRLTHENFLTVYKQILPETGEIFFKTDKRDFFDFSVNELKKCGINLAHITYDLHNGGFEGNIMTEYEEFFLKQGMPICRLEARLSPAPCEIVADGIGKS
ncbi:tRNA (guanine-N(7)-)-methyltransferase [bioreactor metagenome]|uniref:tRNA (guanine(46)-N(7))-methyltransferase n=1 Tax=bioreactor metagenome TaxID=1076179 RepID=A0A645FLZ1_9ZZZZ